MFLLLASYTVFGGGPTLRTLFELYLRPWREFARQGGRGVMAAHNVRPIMHSDEEEEEEEEKEEERKRKNGGR